MSSKLLVRGGTIPHMFATAHSRIVPDFVNADRSVERRLPDPVRERKQKRTPVIVKWF